MQHFTLTILDFRCQKKRIVKDCSGTFYKLTLKP